MPLEGDPSGQQALGPTTAGLMFAVIVGVEARFASIAGALFGKKLRNGLGQVAALRKA